MSAVNRQIYHVPYKTEEITKFWGFKFPEPYLIVENVTNPHDDISIYQIVSLYHQVVSIPASRSSKLVPADYPLFVLAWNAYSEICKKTGMVVRLSSVDPTAKAPTHTAKADASEKKKDPKAEKASGLSDIDFYG